MTHQQNNGFIHDETPERLGYSVNSISGSQVHDDMGLGHTEVSVRVYSNRVPNGADHGNNNSNNNNSNNYTSNGEVDHTGEYTLDEAEEEDVDKKGRGANNTEQQEEVQEVTKSCCSGPGKCWSVFSREVRTTAADIGEYINSPSTQDSIKKHCCSYNAVKTYVPCLKWLPSYRWQQLKGDVIAGLTTGFSVLPQGLAYGQIVEVKAVYGLYSSFMGSFVYSIFGTSKDIAVGPSAVVAILTAQYATGRSPCFMNPTYAILLAFFTGIFQIGLGIFRLGFLLSFISLPVLKRFRAGAGITIFMSRIKKWWGLNTIYLPPVGVPREFLPQLYWTLKKLPETNIYDFLLGGLCIVMLFTFKHHWTYAHSKLRAAKWKTKFRDMPIHWKIVKKLLWFLGTERNIIVVVFAGAVVYGMIIRNINISYTGYIVPGVPSFQAPNFTLTCQSQDFSPFYHFNFPIPLNSSSTGQDQSALSVVYGLSDIASDIGVGFFFIPLTGIFETVSIGKALGRKGRYKIDYNQELIALGLSNLLTSFVSGHPIAGAFLRSGINFNAGVQTPLGGILAATVVLLALAFWTTALSYIPTCAMAATIMMGAVDVISFHKVGFLWKIKKIDLIPWLFTFISSITLGIEYGVFFGVGSTLLIDSWAARRPSMKVISNVDGVATVLLRPSLGFRYPAADKLAEKLTSIVNVGTTKSIVLDLRHVFSIDSTIIYSLMRLHESLKRNNVQLLFTEIQPKVQAVLDTTWLKDSYKKVTKTDENHNSTVNGHVIVIPMQNDANDDITRF